MKQEDILEILKKGSDEWNSFKKTATSSHVDLSTLNLSCKDFRNYDFSNCILTKTNFQKSHLGNTNFNGVKANHANFKNAYFNKSQFENSDLRDSNFKATIVKNSNFNFSLCNRADFSGSKIQKTSLISANIRESQFCSTLLDDVNLTKAHFERSLFRDAKITNSELPLVKLNDSQILFTVISDCNFKTSMLYNSIFDSCEFEKCDLSNTLFTSGKIINSNIRNTNLTRIDFRNTQLTSDTFINCDLSKSKIFGVSAWKLSLVDTIQEDLRISDAGEPKITIDNIEVAQFIYLLINNEKLRNVISTITSKVVLILGRFTADRMQILNLLREELRHRNYLPVLFDFENSPNRDITETVSTLALLSKFIIADITEPKSIPQELSQIVPHMTSLPVQPIILSGHSEYGMFEHFQRYPWVLDIIEYKDDNDIKANVLDQIIDSCERKISDLRK
jgi:uncharacterized protein YjbI with pentapeptide repeats